MGSAWSSGDVLKQNRMNRAWILGRLLAPMYDEDASAVVTVTAKPKDGETLSASVTTLYTAPASGVVQVHSLTIHNRDTVARAVEIYLVASGGSAGVPERIFDDTVQAGETVVLAPLGGWFLGASGTIRGKAAAAGVVPFRAEVSEYAAQPGGLTLKVVDGVQLSTSYVTYYTVPATGVTHALLLNYTLCNTNVSTRNPQVNIVENGDISPGAEDEIFSDNMITKETVIDDTPRVLEPGDYISCAASAANAISFRATILEVT